MSHGKSIGGYHGQLRIEMRNEGSASQRYNQIGVYRSGKALKSHVNSAHGGEFILTCPACIEIKKRQEQFGK